jgi:hypothetical protein
MSEPQDLNEIQEALHLGRIFRTLLSEWRQIEVEHTKQGRKRHRKLVRESMRKSVEVLDQALQQVGNENLSDGHLPIQLALLYFHLTEVMDGRKSLLLSPGNSTAGKGEGRARPRVVLEMLALAILNHFKNDLQIQPSVAETYVSKTLKEAGFKGRFDTLGNWNSQKLNNGKPDIRERNNFHHDAFLKQFQTHREKAANSHEQIEHCLLILFLRVRDYSFS